MNNYNQNNLYGNNTMNFGPIQRDLNSQLQDQLKEMIPGGSKVSVTAVLGDGEAFNFATIVKNYLDSQGYTVDGVNQAVFSGPVRGQNIERPKDGNDTYNVIIGSNI